jgi:iron complex transport system substrate-binding protein
MDNHPLSRSRSSPDSRVAIFPLPIPEAMIAIDGGTERLAGINPLARSMLMNSVNGQQYPGIANINTDLVSRDFVPNVEELVRAKPDVVIQWDFNLDTVVAPMENAGLKVIYRRLREPRSAPRHAVRLARRYVHLRHGRARKGSCRWHWHVATSR